MKKYRNFIIITILSGIIGGFIGAFSQMEINLALDFRNNLRLFVFRIFLVLGSIMLATVVGLIISLCLKIKNTDLENISNSIDKKINSLLYISSIYVILSLTWTGTMISKSFTKIEGGYLMISIFSTLISSILQMLSVSVYNRYYPNKKINLYENNADKNLFNKLDEGEKWIVYSCSYSTYQNMQLVYSIMMVLAIVLSVLTSISILLPIVIGLLWIIQTSIYSIKANKYNNEDI